MLRQIFYAFLPYRSYAYPFLVLSAIVVPCWLIFRVYRRRNPAHRLPLGRETLLLVLVVYLVGLAIATLTPNRSSRLLAEGKGGIELHPNLESLTCSAAFLPRSSKVAPFCEYNARANFALFFPLGVLLPLVWTRLRFWRGLQFAIALSITIEMVQYLSSAWGSYRAADINDVILNVCGVSLGLALGFLLRFGRGSSRASPGS